MDSDNRAALLENGLENVRKQSDDLGLDDLESLKRGAMDAMNLRWTHSKTRSLVCRTSVLTCTFIVCVHLILVYTIDVGSAIDRIAKQQASIVLPGSVHFESGGVQETRRRSKRDLSASEDGLSNREDAASPAEAASEADTRILSQAEDVVQSSSSSSASSSSSSSSICRFGHIQGLNAVCDSQPCLKRLPVTGDRSDASQASNADLNPSTSHVLRRINRISGRMDPVHLSLLPFIARFHWSNGIYGSVGEFGVATGKFTALLSAYTDVDAGERLFVCDCFNRSSSSSRDLSVAGLSSFQVFMAHMKDFGFDEEDTGPRKLHLHRGSSLNLDRELFSLWDLPQFRLISIDSDLNQFNLLSDLETAACLLRDGGVIVINGVDDSESRQLTTSTLVSFLQKHGHSALTPIVSAGNRLYLTTSNWKRKYVQALTSDVILQNSGVIQSVAMDTLASEHLTVMATL